MKESVLRWLPHVHTFEGYSLNNCLKQTRQNKKFHSCTYALKDEPFVSDKHTNTIYFLKWVHVTYISH